MFIVLIPSPVFGCISQRLKVHGHLLGDVYTRITYFFPINYVDSTNSPMRVYDVPR